MKSQDWQDDLRILRIVLGVVCPECFKPIGVVNPRGGFMAKTFQYGCCSRDGRAAWHINYNGVERKEYVYNGLVMALLFLRADAYRWWKPWTWNLVEVVSARQYLRARRRAREVEEWDDLFTPPA